MYETCCVFYQHALLASSVCRLKEQLLLKLVECSQVGSGDTNVTSVRSKSLKCIAAVIDLDPSLLKMELVRDSIALGLADQAASVREAALDILEREMVRNGGAEATERVQEGLEARADVKKEEGGVEDKKVEGYESGVDGEYYDMLA